ncbi:hypothetical protein Nepgr_003843 [Nepenthes gracilis]|uniref:Uncharacterized protein n=1 Tax=Nepenthes gracilis TaxID=150966 RepID=A0AAD3S096_NEPGR|nr:hypothetical protein Nepgr_003843 [Nepenthes gracilis]
MMLLKFNALWYWRIAVGICWLCTLLECCCWGCMKVGCTILMMLLPMLVTVPRRLDDGWLPCPISLLLSMLSVLRFIAGGLRPESDSSLWEPMMQWIGTMNYLQSLSAAGWIG